jgi:hypothetical protein
MFRASESFTEYVMEAAKVHPDVKYMPDLMFYK